MTDVRDLDIVSMTLLARGRRSLKRDMDLVRRILLHVQKKDTILGEQVVFDDVDPDVLGRHVELLHQEQLLEGSSARLSHLAYPRIQVTDLTWSGHDFVAALQDEGVWQQIKQRLTPAEMASVPLGILKSIGLGLLEKYLKNKVGL